MKRSLAAALMAAALAFGAAGCTSDGSGGDGPSPSASGGTKGGSDSPTADPSNVSPPLKKVPKVKRAKGAIKDLTLGECNTDAGKQSVTGSITSSAAKTVDYLVTVSWTTPTSDVMGRGFAVLRDVSPGQTVEFTIEAKVQDGAERCVPGVVFGTIKG